MKPPDSEEETDVRRLLESGWQKSVAPPSDANRPSGPPRAAAGPAETPEQFVSADGPKEDRNYG